MAYLDTVRETYRDAAIEPAPELCCTTRARYALPGLHVPEAMRSMDYGCGSTVDPRDLRPGARVLYVGVGGGLEALAFAYFTRTPGSVLGVDPVAEMRARARENLVEAARTNDWFLPEMVEVRDGDALALPVADASTDLVAQNCLFNVFEREDLRRALREARRALVPGGRLLLSDPIAPRPIPGRLARDEKLRAKCLSGALLFEEYVGEITAAGFGTVEVRARRPFRVLDRRRYGLEQDLLLECTDVCAIAEPAPPDGPCVFTGRRAFYLGPDASFDDGAGHVLPRDVPVSVCDKTARALAALDRPDLVLTEPTWHHDGSGCC